MKRTHHLILEGIQLHRRNPLVNSSWGCIRKMSPCYFACECESGENKK